MLLLAGKQVGDAPSLDFLQGDPCSRPPVTSCRPLPTLFLTLGEGLNLPIGYRPAVTGVPVPASPFTDQLQGERDQKRLKLQGRLF
jgi:hypothetical protein